MSTITRKITTSDYNERFKFLWSFAIGKYSEVFQRVCDSKKKILIRKFTRLIGKGRTERILALADPKFRKKFKLDEGKVKFLTPQRILKNIESND